MLTKLFWFLKIKSQNKFLFKKKTLFPFQLVFHIVFAILDTYKSPPNESTYITEITKIVTYCRSSYNDI